MAIQHVAVTWAPDYDVGAGADLAYLVLPAALDESSATPVNPAGDG